MAEIYALFQVHFGDDFGLDNHVPGNTRGYLRFHNCGLRQSDDTDEDVEKTFEEIRKKSFRKYC